MIVCFLTLRNHCLTLRFLFFSLSNIRDSMWHVACGILCLASWPPVLSIYLQISGFHSLGFNNIPMYNYYKFLFTKEITKCLWSWVIAKHVQIVSLVSYSEHFCIEIIFLCLKKKGTDGFGTSPLSLMLTGRVRRALLWKPNADEITKPVTSCLPLSWARGSEGLHIHSFPSVKGSGLETGLNQIPWL